jgi:hypothetical protein
LRAARCRPGIDRRGEQAASTRSRRHCRRACRCRRSFADLAAEHLAAHRRLAAATSLLTEARKDGAADKIAAARRRLDAAYAECDRVGRANIAEMQDPVAGRQANLDELLEQMDRSWAANAAMTKALGRPDVDEDGRP